ncbi:MAG: RecQ family ATP-dependent DNA helicase [Deltaproteobacteria bacterium]|nr:RecQ family ATP-dependent DNA helicase [Deltaproteobacteria bacterium]MBW1738061.1 RecQ family ATP-dependent DNA helicase [Deltaproteobacteria bacterium]MBW1910815.1 RecQ family ATP-dependent DNA helicase [Deltaproteobacteria bacterium]MBW2035031.1 RecQ family ATP-dependent DNA helicase [Deltaproteobacteria bacterium]MBW2115411.1 RecQ family ATP-dependent DNA helicase [Deltaproteobacteria bacterium]
MLEEHLYRHFGFESFMTGQRDVIELITRGDSAVAIFPTGSGKSLCYQLPALLLTHMTLVVSPLLALMKDQVDYLISRNIAAARLDSTLEPEAYNEILFKAKKGELKILMISVERFKNERFRHHLENMDISLLVVDEAHCISQWGHNFRPEYLKLPVYKKGYRIPQTLLMTATATPPVIMDMCSGFDIPRENVIITGFYRKNLFLKVTPVKESEKPDMLLDRINEEPDSPTIVYVTLQHTAEETAEFLASKGIRSACYHAGMKNRERERIQEQFMGGTISCVVATIAFGMGIDKKDIRRIIHFDLPKTLENYSQEIGRAGRDGKSALCELLANRDNISILENFIYGDTPEKQAIADLLGQIRAQPEFIWEFGLIPLSFELNIRLLPLKTLLVYLEMAGIIRPKFTYFDLYAFQYLKDRDGIVGSFKGERRDFAASIFDHCETKKIWTYVDVDSMVAGYGAERKRVVAALEYFDEQGWIRLQARQSVEVFDLMDKSFDIDHLAKTMFEKFKEREAREIEKIHKMILFFENGDCISKALAGYFGETIAVDRCGHCSACKGHLTRMPDTRNLKPLTDLDLKELISGFLAKQDPPATPLDMVKFICGIQTPAFMKIKARSLPNFGVLKQYPFMEVKTWVEANLECIN